MAGPRDIDETDDEEILDPNEEGAEGTDAGRIDDESGDDAQTGQEFEGDQAQERVDRRSRRDDTLREELRAQREHNARVEAELQALRQEREARQIRPQEESEEQFMARVALMDPEQRMDEKLRRSERRHAQQIALATFSAADRADQVAYESRSLSDATRKRLAPRVEELRRIELRNGRDFPRETLFLFALGEEQAKRMATKGTSPAVQQAQRRVQSQQARTTGGRGDEPREQRQRRYSPNDNSPEAVRSRLEAPDAYI